MGTPRTELGSWATFVERSPASLSVSLSWTTAEFEAGNQLFSGSPSLYLSPLCPLASSGTYLGILPHHRRVLLVIHLSVGIVVIQFLQRSQIVRIVLVIALIVIVIAVVLIVIEIGV